jgi:hypothetical protein
MEPTKNRLIKRGLLTTEEREALINLFKREQKTMDIMFRVFADYLSGLCDIRELDLRSESKEKKNIGFIAGIRYWAAEYLGEMFDELMGYRELAAQEAKRKPSQAELEGATLPSTAEEYT